MRAESALFTSHDGTCPGENRPNRRLLLEGSRASRPRSAAPRSFTQCSTSVLDSSTESHRVRSMYQLTGRAALARSVRAAGRRAGTAPRRHSRQGFEDPVAQRYMQPEPRSIARSIRSRILSHAPIAALARVCRRGAAHRAAPFALAADRFSAVVHYPLTSPREASSSRDGRTKKPAVAGTYRGLFSNHARQPAGRQGQSRLRRISPLKPQSYGILSPSPMLLPPMMVSGGRRAAAGEVGRRGAAAPTRREGGRR
jgi:hypothetical protein